MNHLPANKNRRVLVIDDNRAIHDDFRKILCPATARVQALEASEAALFGNLTSPVHQSQFEVDSAYQGQEGVARVKEALETGRPYAMAFVDVRMPPGWDGVETTRKIWEIDPDLQVVLCTAYSDYSWNEMFKKLGHRDGLLILKKPFDSVEAFQLAHALTEKWRLHRQSRQKMEELESRVAERTEELQHSNHALQTEVAEHQRAEQALRESNVKFHQLADNITDTFWIRSPDMREVHYISPAFERIWGRPLESLYANPHQWADFILPEDRERVRGAFAALTGETTDLDIEYRIVRPDGEIRWVRVRAFQVRDANDKLISHAGIVTDITERKRVTDELRESERRFSDMLGNLQLLSIMLDRDARINYCNDYFLLLTGWKREEVLGRDWFDLFLPPETAGKLHAVHSELIAGLPSAWHHENEIITRSGGRRLIQWNNSVLRSPSGEIVGTASIGEDITERKRAEEELQYKTALLQAQLDSTLDGILVVDNQNNQILKNDRFDQVWKIPRDIAEDVDDRRALQFATNQTKNPTQFLDRVTYLYSHPDEISRDEIELVDGTVLDRYSAPIRDKKGKHYGRIWTFRDITERKRVEEELRSLYTQMQQWLDHAPVVLYRLKIEGENIIPVMASANVTRLLGFTVEETMSYDWWLRQLHPDDRDLALASHPETFNHGASRTEYRLRHKDGSFRWVDDNRHLIRDADGRPSEMVGAWVDITERKQVESQRERLAVLVEASPDFIGFADPKTAQIQYINKHGRRMCGIGEDEDISKLKISDVHPAWMNKFLTEVVLPGAVRDGLWEGEGAFLHRNGREIPVLMALMARKAPSGEVDIFYTVSRDITERKRLEAQLFQSQKMETVGRLAGGVAHEFNSIMTAIIGQSELLLADLPSGNPLAKNATEIHKAADRAAVLTRQLLAYGRKQILQPEILDLNRIIVSMDVMLHQILGSDINLRILPAAGLGQVKADAGQIEQVIMNLAINSRDAMPQGGKLTLETSNVVLDTESVGRYPDLKPGNYVMLAITDTGTGMTPEIKARLFEPFFSTKGVGRGTGLGLATCYGIVKQSGGHINAYSEPGRGTTFKIYLPQVQLDPHPTRPSAPPNLPRGNETILLVEDDPALREMASMLLGRLGYSVLEAPNGLSALAIVEKQGSKSIDLLFTDVVMPELNGKDLSDRLLASHPETRVLFTSAYTENAIVHQGVLNQGVALLQKPFTPGALAHKVREVLDRTDVKT